MAVRWSSYLWNLGINEYQSFASRYHTAKDSIIFFRATLDLDEVVGMIYSDSCKRGGCYLHLIGLMGLQGSNYR